MFFSAVYGTVITATITPTLPTLLIQLNVSKLLTLTDSSGLYSVLPAAIDAI